MKTIKTVPGRTYAVTTTTECTVTTPEGVLIATCPGGVQTLFVAPTTETRVSDDGAVITASFSGASAGSAAGGGVNEKKIGEMIASSEGNVNVLYDSVTQSPPEGNLDNYDAYGWAMVVTEPGRLDTVTLQPRSEGTVKDTFPVYLNIWVQDGHAWKLLGTSENGVEQSLEEASVWTFSGVELVAGQKLHVEAHRQKGSEARDARLSVRVVANSLADTGMIEWNGEVRVVDWVPQYTLEVSRPVGLSARGVALAKQTELDRHTRDAVCHIAAAERESWNAKANTSALAGKVNTATFNAHAGDTVKHVTAAERAQWNELAGGGVTRAEMETYVAEYVAAHAPAVDLSNYQGAIHLRDEAGNEVLRTSTSSYGLPCLYLGSERMMVGLNGDTHVVISGTVDVPVYGVHAGYVSVDARYGFNQAAGTGISYVGNEVRIQHGTSYIDVDATGILLSVNEGLSKINVDSTYTTIKNSRVVISSSESFMKDGSGNACPAGDLRIGDGGLIISQP